MATGINDTSLYNSCIVLSVTVEGVVISFKLLLLLLIWLL